MKKQVLISLGVLAILALLVAPGLAWGDGKVKAGANQYSFYNSGDVLPVPPYGSVDEPESYAKLIVNQPLGEVSVVLTAVFSGLTPGRIYDVHFMNLGCPNAAGWSYTNYGCWTLMGSFTADENGHADYHRNIWADELLPGSTYNLSVWINNQVEELTMLVSDNFEVVVE
jgi:hypothetical protein